MSWMPHVRECLPGPDLKLVAGSQKKCRLEAGIFLLFLFT